MSDKVTQLYPDNSQKKPKRRIPRRLIWILVAVIVLVLGILSVSLFYQELNLDKIRRYVTYLNKRDTGTYGEYVFDAHAANVYHALEDGLAISTVAGLDLYGASGQQLASVSKAINVPQLAVGRKTALAWDAGGTQLCAVSAEGGALLDLETGGAILDADISDDGEICYAAAADGYRTILTVLDKKQTEIYQWMSSSQYLPLCAIADGGRQLAAVAAGQSGGAYESRLQMFETDSEELGSTTSLGNQLILELEFLDDKRLCAVGENSLMMLNTDAEVLGEFSYGQSVLQDYDLGGKGFVLLVMNRYRAGEQCSVMTVGMDGQALANQYLGEEILSVSAAGNYAAVLTAGHLRIYTKDLELYAETDQVGGASQVAMRSDGSVLLIEHGSAQLYLP